MRKRLQRQRARSHCSADSASLASESDNESLSGGGRGENNHSSSSDEVLARAIHSSSSEAQEKAIQFEALKFLADGDDARDKARARSILRGIAFKGFNSVANNDDADEV